MKVEQISVFLENKAGRLAEVTRVLGEAGINIRALSLADTTDFGILRLIVDQYDRAREILKDKGFTVGKTEVVAPLERLDAGSGQSQGAVYLVEGKGVRLPTDFDQQSPEHRQRNG